MKHILVDTCDWIELGRKHSSLRTKIIELAQQQVIKIVLPELIEIEWNRHKEEKVVKSKRSGLLGQLKNAKGIVSLIEPNRQDEFMALLSYVSEDAIEAQSTEDVIAIDEFFDSDYVVRIQTSDNVKLSAISLALDKKAPFHQKNSMADALILLSFLEYLDENELGEGYFISSNTKDFASSDKQTIHPDLADLVAARNVKYVSNIGQAIENIQNGIVSDDEIAQIEYVNNLRNVLESLQLENVGANIFDNLSLQLPESALADSFSSIIASQIATDSVLEQIGLLVGQSQIQNIAENISAIWKPDETLLNTFSDILDSQLVNSNLTEQINLLPVNSHLFENTANMIAPSIVATSALIESYNNMVSSLLSTYDFSSILSGLRPTLPLGITESLESSIDEDDGDDYDDDEAPTMPEAEK